MLFAPDGRVEAATSDAPADRIWHAISDLPAGLVEFEVDGWHTLAVPVAAGQGPTKWLALTSPASAVGHPHDAPGRPRRRRRCSPR